jgi:hypothetical protein
VSYFRRRGRKHWQARSRGKFTRNTVTNTFGLKVWVCAACGGFNPRSVGEPKPERCGHEGCPSPEPFVDLAEVRKEEL